MRNPARILCSARTEEAGYCQHIKDEAYKASRARWALDFSGIHEVEDALYAHACNLAVVERWKIPKDLDYPQLFTELAVYELRNPKEFSMLTPEKRNADEGRKPNHAKRALFLNIVYKTYMNHWKRRYEAVYLKLEDDIDDSFRMIWRNQVDIDKIY